nr:DUF1629 domain-containing protein [uncultured Flavobacterium sp.]
MNYYIIQESGNLKIIGKYPQVQTIHNNCHVWDEPKFVEHIHHEKVDFEPITSNAILHKKSKQTDLINVNGAMGFSGKLLISGKLKTILENNRKSGMQFFKAPIIQNDILINDYWLLNMYEFSNEFVDFNKSTIYYRKYNPNEIEDFNIIHKKSLEDFNGQIKINTMFDEFYLYSISIKPNIIDDFFQLNFTQKYVVSEKLKKEIEDADCTGIEFQPIELSFNEWTMPGGEREKLYGKAK